MLFRSGKASEIRNSESEYLWLSDGPWEDRPLHQNRGGAALPSQQLRPASPGPPGALHPECQERGCGHGITRWFPGRTCADPAKPSGEWPPRFSGPAVSSGQLGWASPVRDGHPEAFSVP